MINTDIFLKIGSQHSICEDYIVKGISPAPYIILSDGCSSSNNTEMGSRILCHIAKQYLKYRQEDLYSIDYKKMGNWVIHNAEMTVRHLGLSVNCLDATLIISYLLDNVIYIVIYGDGTIISKKNNKIDFLKVDFSNNAPFYLSYLIDDYRYDLYHQMKNEKSLTKTTISEGLVKTSSETCSYDYPLSFSFKIDEIDTLFICSDGISSFIVEDPTKRKILEPSEFISNFLQFKNIKGEYLKRRLTNALKDLNKNGINHYDDLSIGSFVSTKEN